MSVFLLTKQEKSGGTSDISLMPSMCCVIGNRRGNWITLKMRKLIKSKKDVNRERLKSMTLTPTRSESSEGFLQLPHQDSQDSSSVGSNSLEDGQTLGTKKSSSEYCKTFVFLLIIPD